MEPTPLAQGTLLNNGTYRIEKILGQGGFGITYLALDLKRYKLVAIKEYFPKDLCGREDNTTDVRGLTADKQTLADRHRQKFVKEAAKLAKLDHPNIVHLIEAFDQNGTAYYTMNFVNGTSLNDLVRTKGPLDLATAIKYINQIGEALSYLHERNINHLDVKTANIMLDTETDTCVLIDFGLAKQYDEKGGQTSTTPTGLSHGYAALEQYVGSVSTFTPATDIYSLAATLYFLLTGTVPPQAPELAENDLTFPSSVPMALRPIIEQAMSPARKKRQSSISQFLEQINAADKSPAASNNTANYSTTNDDQTQIFNDDQTQLDNNDTTQLDNEDTVNPNDETVAANAYEQDAPPADEDPDNADDDFEDDEAKSKRKKLRIFLAIACAIFGFVFSRYLSFILAYHGIIDRASYSNNLMFGIFGIISAIALVLLFIKPNKKKTCITTIIASIAYCMTAFPTSIYVGDAWYSPELDMFNIMEGNKGYFNMWGTMKIPNKNTDSSYMIGIDTNNDEVLIIIDDYMYENNLIITAYNLNLNPISTPEKISTNDFRDINMNISEWAIRKYNLKEIIADPSGIGSVIFN